MDLKLSMKYMGPTNILCTFNVHWIFFYLFFSLPDTHCTAALHLGQRSPDTARLLFADRKGCFERPSLDKEPSVISLPKLQVDQIKLQVAFDSFIAV